MNKKSADKSGAIFGWLCIGTFLVLALLKACGLIAWPWVAIFVPLFVFAGMVSLALLILIPFALVAFNAEQQRKQAVMRARLLG